MSTPPITRKNCTSSCPTKPWCMYYKPGLPCPSDKHNRWIADEQAKEVLPNVCGNPDCRHLLTGEDLHCPNPGCWMYRKPRVQEDKHGIRRAIPMDRKPWRIL